MDTNNYPVIPISAFSDHFTHLPGFVVIALLFTMNPALSAESNISTEAWHGKWKTEYTMREGTIEKILSITPSKITASETNKNTSRTVSYDYHRVYRSDYELGAAEFGIADKTLSVEDIRKSYADAVKYYKTNPDDFSVSDIAKSRRALDSITPRSYQVLWAYDGGSDCGYFEYIVDEDRMIERSQCRYGETVRLYKRVRNNNQKKKVRISILPLNMEHKGEHFDNSTPASTNQLNQQAYETEQLQQGGNPLDEIEQYLQ